MVVGMTQLESYLCGDCKFVMTILQSRPYLLNCCMVMHMLQAEPSLC